MPKTRLVSSLLFIALAGCAGGSGRSGGAAPAGTCEVVGTWVGQVPAGMLAGRVLSMVFAADQTAQGTCDRVTLNSRWQRNGDLVDVVDVSANPPFAQCDPSLVGRYTLEFSADCQTVRAISGVDPCEHRRQALLDFRASRR